MVSPAKPLAAIIGGAKVSDKIGLLGNLIEKVDKIIDRTVEWPLLF